MSENEEEKKMKSEIISISLAKSLLDKVDSVQVEREFASRSEVIRHALLTYFKDLDSIKEDDTVGIYIVGVSYFSAKMKPAEIQEIIKDFSNDIINSTRIKISQSINVILYVLKTNINIVRIFHEKLSGIKGLIDKKLFTLKVAV